MAHFALIDNTNTVVKVIVVNNDSLLDNNGVELEELGIKFCNEVVEPGRWLQTSYNHKFRGRFAGIGYLYSEELDVFHPPQPTPGLILTDSGHWVPPTPPPDDINLYEWSGEELRWVPILIADDTLDVIPDNPQEVPGGEQTVDSI